MARCGLALGAEVMESRRLDTPARLRVVATTGTHPHPSWRWRGLLGWEIQPWLAGDGQADLFELVTVLLDRMDMDTDLTPS